MKLASHTAARDEEMRRMDARRSEREILVRPFLCMGRDYQQLIDGVGILIDEDIMCLCGFLVKR